MSKAWDTKPRVPKAAEREGSGGVRKKSLYPQVPDLYVGVRDAIHFSHSFTFYPSKMDREDVKR